MLDGTTSAAEALNQARENAFQHADLNAIAHADWDGAKRLADEYDEQARAGRPRGPLHGLPISIKDLYAVRGMPLRAGTKADLPPSPWPEAIAVERLRSAGAILFAKTNMHEIALGATGENRWTGDVLNPYDTGRQAGGSSSGAAVAVATGIGVAGLGSDTGGSVRVPAAFCGVVGFKPTYGHIPLSGALPLSWTFDHAGPLTRSVADARTLYEVLAQRQAKAAATGRAPRLVMPGDWLQARLAPAVALAFTRLQERLRSRGATIESVPTPKLPLSWECYTPIVRAEAAFVHRDALAKGGEGFSELVAPALAEGAKLPASQYFIALQQRQEVRAELAGILRGFDAMILPTAPVIAPRRGQLEVETGSGLMNTRQAVLGQTLPFSMCGLPAISLPFAVLESMPLGLQIVGAHDADAQLLALAEWVEAQIAS